MGEKIQCLTRNIGHPVYINVTHVIVNAVSQHPAYSNVVELLTAEASTLLHEPDCSPACIQSDLNTQQRPTFRHHNIH